MPSNSPANDFKQQHRRDWEMVKDGNNNQWLIIINAQADRKQLASLLSLHYNIDLSAFI